jgi:hypothetical protein
LTHLLDYQPLNLYTNYQEAAEKTPTVPIIFDESLPAFPAFINNNFVAFFYT